MAAFFVGIVVAAHLAFVAFAAAGGALVLRWPRLAFLHLPAVAWAAFVELSGISCPLTPLEIALRDHAALTGYEGGFLERYGLALLYPEGLTREVQIALGAAVLVGNAVLYAWLAGRLRAGAEPRRAPLSGSKR